jgi:hypothetical protein
MYQRQKEAEFVLTLVIRSFMVTYNFFRDLLFPIRPNEEVIALGRVIDEFGQETRLIGLLDSEVRKHIHVIGGSGRGKTTLLVNVAIQLMLLKRSLVIIDPKGDLVDMIMSLIPPNRFEDVILFDPTDREYPLAFNVFESVPATERSRVAGEILLIFKKITAQGSWGPRLESALRLAILALLEIPGSTLLDLYYFLTDDKYRMALLPKITDKFVKDFWSKQFSTMKDSQQDQVINPILNKIEPWLSYEIARYILGQSNSSFSLSEAIDTGKIILVRIPQGILGEDLSSLIGALMVTKLQMEVMGRATAPMRKRKLVHLLVDEFQDFTTSSFEKILSQARSFGLSIICANQFSAQLAPELMQSLESNCAVRLTCHMDGSHHLVHFHLLQDINQPELWIRPLLPAKNRSREISESIRYLSQLRYGTEVADVIEQLALKDLRREYYEQVQSSAGEVAQTKTVNMKQPTQTGNLSSQPQQPPVMKHGKRKTTKTQTP